MTWSDLAEYSMTHCTTAQFLVPPAVTNFDNAKKLDKFTPILLRENFGCVRFIMSNFIS